MIQVYGIKNCDSVKKALRFFKENDLKFTLFDFKSESLPCQKIEYWLTKVEIKTLFNARSTTYRNLNLKEMKLNEREQAEWLCKENLLIKRPVIEYNNEILIGFHHEKYQKVFL